MLTHQLRADLLKARSGRGLLVLVPLAILLLALSNLAVIALAGEQLTAGAATAATLTHDLVRNAFTLILFAALFGALMVTTEYRTGLIGRTLLLRPQRDVVLISRTAVAAAAGAAFGGFAVVLGLVSAWAGTAVHGQPLVLDGETWLICVGVFAVNLASCMWGSLLGWIVRNQVVAVVAVVVQMLLLEPALMEFAPAVGKFLPTSAMGSVFRDVNPELLGPVTGLAVLVAWLVACGLLARKLITTRDAY